MMLTIHGLPVMVKYHDLKTLIKQECNINDFILDNLVGDLDGFKKVRIGVADEVEGSRLTKCLNGYRMGGNVLRVVPIAKAATNQPSNKFEQHGGFMPRTNMPSQPGNFNNQPVPLMGNRSAVWTPGPANQNISWSGNQQQQNPTMQNNFPFQQGASNQQFSQQQPGPAQRPGNKPFTQNRSFSQNQPALDKNFGFGSSSNITSRAQVPGQTDRARVLRSMDLVPDPLRTPQTTRFHQENYDQNKPVTINKDYFQGANSFNEPQQTYAQGPGPSNTWNKQPTPQQKPPQFEKTSQFDDKRQMGHDKGRFSPQRGPHDRRGSPGRERRMSPGRKPSPGDRRRKSPGRRDSPPKRISPNRRLVSPNRRFSPSRHHSDKNYSDRGSQSKQIRPAYEPDGKAQNQAMYSGGYRPNAHDVVQYPGPGGRQVDQREPLWQQDREKNIYSGSMKKTDDDRRDARLPRGPEPIEPNRPSPMHKSRSPSRRDVRERSPLRDRYKRHSPSPRSPRRSWALEKRRSPDINQAPPPPMWPGQNQDDQYGREKGETNKHVPVWDHRTLEETEEAMRRDSRAYAEERTRRDVEPRDASNRREPSPRRHVFKPHEERFSPKNAREFKFESRDPKFESRDPKFESRDPKFEPRNPKFEPRDPKFEPRDPKFEPRDPKYESRDPKFENRGPKFEPRDVKFEQRDPKFDQRNPKFEQRDHKFEPRDHKFEPRDHKFEPRDHKFEPRDLKFEPRDHKFEPRDLKFEPRDDKFESRPRKFEPREHQFEPRDRKVEQANVTNFETRGPRFEPRDPKFEGHGPNYEPRDPKFGVRASDFELRERDAKFELRDANFELRDEPRGSNFDQHKYDSRSSKFEPGDPKFQSRNPKFEPRDSKFEQREPKFKPTFEPVETTFPEREPQFEPRDAKYTLRDHKFEARDRKYESRGDYKDRRDFRLDDDPFDRNNPERDFREYQRPYERPYKDEISSRREEFPQRDERKESRQQPPDEFQKEFEDIYKRTVEFKQKVQELRRTTDRERGSYSREDRRREPERDVRSKPDNSDRHHDSRDIYRHDMERRQGRSRSPRLEEKRKGYDEEKLQQRDATSRKFGLPADIQVKRDKAVENIASKMMEKYGNFEMSTYMKLRVKEDLQVAISRILHDMFGPKDISFIEMVVKFNSKHDQRSEQRIFEEAISCFPGHLHKSMKRSAQDSDRSEIPTKTSKGSPDHDPNLKGDNTPAIINQSQMPDWNFVFGQQGFIPNMHMPQFEVIPQMVLPMNPNPVMVPSPFTPQIENQDVTADEKEDGYNLYLCKDDFKPLTEIQADLLKQFLVSQIFKVTETSNGWAPEFTLKGLQSMFRYEVHTFDEESKNWLLNFDFSEFKLFRVLVYTKEELWYERAAIWLPGHSKCRHIEPLDKLKLQNKKLDDIQIGKWKFVKKIINCKGTRIYVDMPPASARALEKHKMMLSYELQKVNVFLKAVAVDKDAFDGLQESSTIDQAAIAAAASSYSIPSLKDDNKIVKISLKGSKSLSPEQVKKIKEMVIYQIFKYHQQSGPSRTDFVKYGFCAPNSLGILPENQESRRWLTSIDIGRLNRQPIVILNGDSTNTRYLKMLLMVYGDHNCNTAIVAERLKQSNQGVKGINFNLWKPITVVNDRSSFKFEVELDMESAETISKMKFQLDYVDDRNNTKVVHFKPKYSMSRFTELIEKYKAELTDSYDVANMDLASSDSDEDIICLGDLNE